MPKAVGTAAKKRKGAKANGHQLAEPLPLGEVLQDISKNEWKLGPAIGQGGFGVIYSAKEAQSKASSYPYVIKIEPHANGPLFVEMHFFIKIAKREDVEAFKKQKGLKRLGMPLYFGTGSHEYKSEKYRFIVMEKFGSDLWKLFVENNKIFPTTTVFKIAVQILDVLEYIHSKGYIHADIKATNILLGLTKETQNKQCYLVDFGLATKYTEDKEYKPNPKKKHDGTIEYLSRDAHQGVQTRRGDLEILAYNIIQWLGCTLPWEKNLSDPNAVQQSKEESMLNNKNMSQFLKSTFVKQQPPGPLVEYLKYIISLKHYAEPNYLKIRKIFLSGLDPTDSLDKPLVFSMNRRSASGKTPTKRKSTPDPKEKKVAKKARPSDNEKENLKESEDEDEDEDEDVVGDSGEESYSLRTRRKINYVEQTKSPKRITKKKTVSRKLNQSEGEETDLIANTDAIKGASNKEREKVKPKRKKQEDKEDIEDDNMVGYTPSMKEIMLKKIEKDKSKKNVKNKDNVDEDMAGFTESMKEIRLKKLEKDKSRKIVKNKDNVYEDMTGFTESMKEIALKKKVAKNTKKH